MVKNLMKIAWICVLLCYEWSYLLLIGHAQSSGFIVAVFLMGAAGLAAWFYVAIRIFIFKKKLVNFCRHIISGNYDVGIKSRSVASDEIKALADLINKAAQRLRVYDELRAGKVDLSVRVKETIFNNTKEAIVIADTEERLFQFNAAARELFGIKEERLTFSILEKQQRHAVFFALFKEVAEREKVAKEARLAFDPSMRNTPQEVLVKIFPVKDREEKVKAAVVFLKRTG